MSFGDVDVLVFGPHPDDVEIFCGGTVIRLVDLGHSVGVVDLTRGELATHGTVEQRAREAEAASRILGVKFRENLGLPDGGLDASSASQCSAIVRAIRRHRPELVLAPWIEGRHPDHAAAGELLTRAMFFAALRKFETTPPTERFAPRQLLYYQLRHRMAPSFILDTSEAAERKRKAIACYGSQFAKAPGEVPTLIGSPQAVEAIDARDRYFGSMIGATHGEALRSPNALGLVDPVAHFRQNPFTQAHAFEGLR